MALSTPAYEAHRCSLVAREIGEPLPGTAPVAPAWLLVEEAGPWPARSPGAVTANRVDADAMAGLSDRFDDLPIRLQWIRGVGREERVGPTRRVLLVHPRDPHTGADGWTERLDVAHAGELAGLDPEALLSPTPPGVGDRHGGIVAAVCTHAKKDVCCAALGRPAADALVKSDAAMSGAVTVVETTHLGGHRFAATFAVFPEGVVYGHVPPDDATRILGGHLDGRLDVAHLRGRSALDAWGQAAECFTRHELDLWGVADVTIGDVDEHVDGTATVDVRTTTGAVRVALARRPLGVRRLLGCAKDTPEDPGSLVLLGLDHADRVMTS